MKTWMIYIVSHKDLMDEMYSKDSLFSKENYTAFNVGAIEKLGYTCGLDEINQKKFSTFKSLGPWWAESEAIYNLWISGEWGKYDYVGFIHYDIELKLSKKVCFNRYNISERIQKAISDKDRLHISFESYRFNEMYRQKIMADTSRPNEIVGDGFGCYEYILRDYNEYYKTNYSIKDLRNKSINLCSCFFVDGESFNKMMLFWDWIVNSKKLEAFDTNHKNRFQGGLAERYFGVWLMLEKLENVDFSLVHHYNTTLSKGR
ncbi:hypothetical protein [Butyrivibrio proteoclasticus]|uniref:hypothetical protein n=1 Tax=Butyrivibrio proteoclasticus TaxID=43305 RepID=UPI0004799683|nr:hypothetical protein [Butyrivibrio proteoclasticus]